jgi:hypothetical protein
MMHLSRIVKRMMMCGAFIPCGTMCNTVRWIVIKRQTEQVAARLFPNGKRSRLRVSRTVWCTTRCCMGQSYRVFHCSMMYGKSANAGCMVLAYRKVNCRMKYGVIVPYGADLHCTELFVTVWCRHTVYHTACTTRVYDAAHDCILPVTLLCCHTARCTARYYVV